MRSKPSTAMQKTYDECYLICSTAVYFENQNNEAEALRSWRNALDQINYHNAYRMPSNYRPKSETEKALQDSLHHMELQCRERVDLLEALKRSRAEAIEGTAPATDAPASLRASSVQHTASESSEHIQPGWTRSGSTVSDTDYAEPSRPPPLPSRPSHTTRKTSDNVTARSRSLPQESIPSPALPPLTPMLSAPQKKNSRTPSPEKKTSMLRTLRPGGRERERSSSSKLAPSLRNRPPAAAKAATLAFTTTSRPGAGRPAGPPVAEPAIPTTKAFIPDSQPEERGPRRSFEQQVASDNANTNPRTPSPFYIRSSEPDITSAGPSKQKDYFVAPSTSDSIPRARQASLGDAEPTQRRKPPTPPPHHSGAKPLASGQKSPLRLPKVNPDVLNYRKEYPPTQVNTKKAMSVAAGGPAPSAGVPREAESRPPDEPTTSGKARTAIRRKAVNTPPKRRTNETSSASGDDNTSSGLDIEPRGRRRAGKEKANGDRADLPLTPTSTASRGSTPEQDLGGKVWKEKVEQVLKHLPKGVDETAAAQILNEIVIQGDEVHWDDVAGLEIAKSALKETVVYPFLRPDLFMGLREPARGMLLFGPPGTGKTMLARAVATESRSTFFAISASSLTSKYLGESEKLVRALFALAKALAPSIIFVDEIDSLLSSRAGSGEHEATRRIKTEFLIQWSDLAKAAAGREQSEKDKERGDASRVLVLAATNLPWAIDEAARRRFVRRQYIPLPEDHVRKLQLRTLLSHQKHSLSDADLDRLVELTDGFSGSDITALAKDAAMGPLRSLGEKLLHMTMDEIRPIMFEDFQASLVNIRPSVSKQGLKQFEDWAREFGERGG
ncbi:hypothetical protein H2201_003352 [Coniosporium apollinis]|uniref:AAA+ ATPase domain-containing protein n=1 Tax=Coniosporium apollinis TaxID=61459 RepID=A0ABQ9NYN2_9PEZI|nr:hypothetical protein H2201_003352 [Coniosporium apollinis]